MPTCGNKDLASIRADHNQWYKKIWDDLPNKSVNWFQDTNQTLNLAFGHLTPAPQVPAIPDRPDPLRGNTVADLADEMKLVTGILINYGLALGQYAIDVNGVCPRACVAQTRPQFNGLKAFQRLMETVPNPPIIPDNPTPLCVDFARWAKRYWEWSLKFEVWENAMVACLPFTVPVVGEQQPTSSVTAETRARLQVSPVPWPPWTGYEDEP